MDDRHFALQRWEKDFERNDVWQRNWLIYHLHEDGGMSYSDIGKRILMSHDRVRMIVYRAHQIVEHRKIVEEICPPNSLGRLSLSPRIVNCLQNCIEGDLAPWYQLDIGRFCRSTTKRYFRQTPNMGEKSMAELEEQMLPFDPEGVAIWRATDHPDFL